MFNVKNYGKVVFLCIYFSFIVKTGILYQHARPLSKCSLIIYNYLLAICDSACWIIFFTMFPPILPASFADISPLYPSFKDTPTSFATSYLNLFNASVASGTTYSCYCLMNVPFFSPPEIISIEKG